MADEGIFVTTDEVKRKAGNNASTVSNVEAYINQYVAEAESEINVFTRFNWTDAYGTLDADNRDILKACAGNLAAIQVIIFDMSGFTSRAEAQTMIDSLRDSALRQLSILRDKKNQEFLENG